MLRGFFGFFSFLFAFATSLFFKTALVWLRPVSKLLSSSFSRRYLKMLLFGATLLNNHLFLYLMTPY